MKIAIFSDNFYPEISGISDSIIALAKELSNMGHTVRFYVPRYSRGDYKKIGVPMSEPAKETDLGANISVRRLFSVPYSTGTGQGRAVIFNPFVYFDVKKFDPDVIHTQLFFGAGLEALFCAKALRKPLIGTNHTAVREFVKYSPLRGETASRMIVKYVNWYYDRCGVITAPSHSSINEMRSDGLNRDDMMAVSNPLDTETFSPIPDKKLLKKKFGFSGHTIVHAGRISPERNIDVLVKAMPYVLEKFPDAELAIAGRGTMEKELTALAGELGAGKAVRFMGFLERHIVDEVYNASELFATASTSDTQSMVMMQAMASGLPIVGVNARALPEYINGKNGFVVEAGNHRAVAEKIIFLLKNAAIRKKLGAGARKFALGFSSGNIAKEWVKIYEKAIRDYNAPNRKNP